MFSVQTKLDFLFRTNTNIRPSKLSEYSDKYEHSDNIRCLAEYSVFGRIFGILAKYNIRQNTEYSAKLPKIRPKTEHSEIAELWASLATSVSAEYSAELFGRILVRNRIRFNTGHVAAKSIEKYT